MGVDLHVYTPREDIVTAEELRRQLRTEGWEVRLVLDTGRPSLEPAPEGPLTVLLDVIGWPVNSEKGGRAAEAIERRDLESLQSLYNEGVVGSCGYGVEYPFEAKDGPDEGWDEEDEEREPIDAVLLEAVRRARTRYVVRVRIRSSDQSYRFLEVVWQAVGRLRDGLLLDPQSGEFRSAPGNP